MNYSRQRERIWEMVTATDRHPTAEEIYRALKPDNPALSLATVYRNLRQLEESGRLLRLTMPDGSDRFDGRTEPHEHLICDVCHRVTDLKLRFSPSLLEQARGQSPFAVTGCRLELRGICPACAKTATCPPDSGEAKYK